MNIDDQLRMKGLASRPVIPGDYGGGQGPRVSAERFVRARLERDKEEAMRDVDRTLEGNARIKVVGIGGGGSNAVNRKLLITGVKISEKLSYQRIVDRVFEQAPNYCAMMTHSRWPSSILLYYVVCETSMQQRLQSCMLYVVHQIPKLNIKFIYIM